MLQKNKKQNTCNHYKQHRLSRHLSIPLWCHLDLPQDLVQLVHEGYDNADP
jgi:hypothetical protein